MSAYNPLYIIAPIAIIVLATVGVSYMDVTSKPFKHSSNAGTGIGKYVHKGGKRKTKKRRQT